MTWVALKSMAGRRVRAALTALAVVLGVAMIAGSLILTDTIDRAFTSIFSSSYTQTDLVVRGESVVDGSFAGTPTVSAELLPRIEALPGVEAAAGSLVDFSGTGNTAKILDREGEVIGGNMPSFGFGVDPADERFNPMTLTTGAWASGPDQVVIDADTAADHDFGVGDTVRVAADGPVREFTVTGVAGFGELNSMGGATIALFDVPTAREVLGKTGFDAIQVAAAPGTSTEELGGRIEAVLPPGAELATGEEQAASDKEVVSEGITFIRGTLLAFGGVALFVGAFVIFNTLSITVAQRSRELATLRTLGASRRQVLRSVIAEAGAIGLAASLVGLALGVALANGLTALFDSVGLTMPQGDMVFATRTVVVSLLVGTLITLLAGLVPAVRATRVPPIAAVREGAALPAGRLSRLGPAVALAAVAGGATLLALGVWRDGGLLAFGAGAVLVFVGVAMTSSRLVRPIAALVGWPIARLGAAGGLARQNAVRNPARTASTAAALMVGLALVTFVSALGAGLLDSTEKGVERQLGAGYVVTSTNGSDPLPAAVGRALAASPDAGTVSSVRGDEGLVEGSAQYVAGVDPATIASVYRFAWTEGSDAALATLDDDGVVVERSFAEDHDLAIGSPVAIVSPSGDGLQRTVTGVYDPPRLSSLLGTALVSQEAFDSAFPRAVDTYVFASGARAASEAGAAALESSLAAFPDADVMTVAGFTEEYAADLSTILNLLHVLLALSVVVSLLGMVNTMVLAVHERTREIGMLRAVGMTRRQARRMVRGESVVTALIGAALGLPLGVALAAVVSASLSDYGVELAVPVGSLVVFALVAAAVGVLAAIAPARRASRLDVLNALQYE
ncbi:MAG TPA: ABC transporter permease [Miltoncostaeaceae bacterium]|nr:ABC transporter permease [Miltoncostaeaceae bacterium]